MELIYKRLVGLIIAILFSSPTVVYGYFDYVHKIGIHVTQYKMQETVMFVGMSVAGDYNIVSHEIVTRGCHGLVGMGWGLNLLLHDGEEARSLVATTSKTSPKNNLDPFQSFKHVAPFINIYIGNMLHTINALHLECNLMLVGGVLWDYLKQFYAVNRMLSSDVIVDTILFSSTYFGVRTHIYTVNGLYSGACWAQVIFSPLDTPVLFVLSGKKADATMVQTKSGYSYIMPYYGCKSGLSMEYKYYKTYIGLALEIEFYLRKNDLNKLDLSKEAPGIIDADLLLLDYSNLRFIITFCVKRYGLVF